MDGNQDKQATITYSLTWKVSFLIYNTLRAEPIEQNVNGSKGVYELVYFVKDSKSLQRFKNGAQQFDDYISTKSDSAIECLVRYYQQV
jgi:hypothetical protein